MYSMFDDHWDKEKEIREIAEKENTLGLIDILKIGSYDNTLEFENDISNNDIE